MPSNRGITLVALVITIVVMLVLASTAIYTGNDVVKNSKRTAFSAELQTIQEKASLYYEKGEASYQSLGIPIDSSSVTSAQKAAITESTGINLTNDFRYFTKDTYKQIELDGIKQDTLVNFKTKQVISVQGLKIDGNIYYTLEQLGEGATNIAYENKTNETISYQINTVIDKNPYWTFQVKEENIQYPEYTKGGILKYKKQGDAYWKDATNYTFEVKEPGIYETKIVDKAGNESDIKKAYAYVKNGLVLYYDGEINQTEGHDTTTNTWQDLSGNDNHGILHNFNQNANSGWNTNYLRFDGIDDSVESTYNLPYNNTKEFSLEFVDVNGGIYTDTANGAKILFETSSNSNDNYGCFYIDTNEYGLNDLTLAIKFINNTERAINHKMVNGILPNTTKAYSLSCNTAKAYDTFIKIYGNGTSQTTTNTEADHAADISNKLFGDYKLYIGSRNNTELFQKMNLGTVRIYKRALTDEEVKINYTIDKDRFNITE